MINSYKLAGFCGMLAILGCNNQGNNDAVPCDQFILGKWKGQGVDTCLTVIFHSNGKAVFDYTRCEGKKFVEPYTVSKCTVNVSLFPEGLIIYKRNENEIEFKKPKGELSKSIETIYATRFRRVEEK